MRCPVCEKSDWENVDHLRLKASGMCMCKNCGFVSYPQRYATEAEAKEYYKKEYRNCPSAHNLFSGQRKVQYHIAFLKDLLEKWKTEKPNASFCDVGAANGMFLNMIRTFLPDAKLTGTEWGINFRKNAYYEYNILLSEDFDDTKKYDFIGSYKVLEHQCDPDLQLQKYAACLADGGYIYLSVPTWHHTMHNGSLATWDQDDRPGLEYYYHPDHINVWSLKHMLHLIAKAGLVIEKENHVYYDDVWLLRKPKAGELVVIQTDVPADDPKEILSKMEKIKKASDFYIEGKFKDALDTFPNFLKAWSMYYEMNRKKFDSEGWDYIESEILEKTMKACENVAEAFGFAADIAMRYDKFEKAIEWADKAVQMRPNSPAFLRTISHGFRQMAHREQEANRRYKLFEQARNISRFIAQISMEHFSESYSWVCQDHAQLPLPNEIPNNVMQMPTADKAV